jgi:hypothetical protein
MDNYRCMQFVDITSMCVAQVGLKIFCRCFCSGRNGVTFDTFFTKRRISAEFLWPLLDGDLDDSNQVCQDDVPRQWHLRGTRGDGDSPYRNEERSPMVLTFSSG